MRLTLHTDYSLRVLMFCAVKGDDLSTIQEIVHRFGISEGHVMKVVHALGQKGYLETIRGKHGGMRLARKSSQIRVGAVVRDMEEELGVVGCLQGERDFCRIESGCVLKGALREATNAFLSVLDRLTIEDLVKPRRPLARLLDIDPDGRVAAGR
ncbi:MAG: Rrf2 family transcriptional regulator [Alphaproteobacteria bacterium]|nr:Rrf2 family transcriptional regulator [Alphaproteobacteria bacterium]